MWCSVYGHPVYSWGRHVRVGDGQVCGGLASDVSGNGKTAVEQIYESPRQRWSFILYRVRTLVLFPFLRELTQQHALISTFLYCIVNMLGVLGNIPQGWLTYSLMVVASVPLYTLTPRFVMNVRELYVLDLQGRCGNDIDTGFGLLNGAGCSMGETTTIGTIAFVERGGIEGLDDEVIAMEEERAVNCKGQV